MIKRSKWRFLLTYLLLVLLPLQGFAATSMLTCGPDQQQLDPQAQTIEPSVSTQASNIAPSTVGHADHLDNKSPCNHCAPCCIGAGLTREVSIHAAAPFSGADFPLLSHIPSSALVIGLDRPPRTFLA